MRKRKINAPPLAITLYMFASVVSLAYGISVNKPAVFPISPDKALVALDMHLSTGYVSFPLDSSD